MWGERHQLADTVVIQGWGSDGVGAEKWRGLGDRQEVLEGLSGAWMNSWVNTDTEGRKHREERRQGEALEYVEAEK